MTMGARLRRRSPPPLRQSQSSSELSSSSVFLSYVSPGPTPAPPGIRRHPNQTRWIVALAGLVACVWLVGLFFVMSFHHEDPTSKLHARFPIPLSTIRGKDYSRLPGHHRMHPAKKHSPKTPKHYFHMSPPTNTTDRESSPPWSWPTIHVVNTRFMQGQGTLVNLARSRLKLLEVVCLPSLMEQTIFDVDTLSKIYQHTKWEEPVKQYDPRHSANKTADPLFLWIIKVDPNMDETVLNELKEILEPVKKFALVVGSNTNYGIGIKPGGWRDGQAGQDILDAYGNGRVFFPGDDGAYQTLRRAHEAREARVVIETRLDADDALNVNYIASLQTSALRTLIDLNASGYGGSDAEDAGNVAKKEESERQTARWLYWCPHAHVQWNPSSSADSPKSDPGMLQVFHMPMTCTTAGLSLGFAIGAEEESVPRYEHSKIYWEIAINHNNEGRRNKTRGNPHFDKHDCGLYPSEHCVVFVKDPSVAAFRSRAMTSAGMNNIEAQGAPSRETPAEYEAMAEKLWRSKIKSQFGIRTRSAKEAADFLRANYLDTVRDNLRGQCTHGHSCKMSSLEKLQMTIDILEEEMGGVDTVGR